MSPACLHLDPTTGRQRLPPVVSTMTFDGAVLPPSPLEARTSVDHLARRPGDAFQAEVVSIERVRLSCGGLPETANHLQLFLEALEPLGHGGKRNAVGAMLGLEPPRSEAELDTLTSPHRDWVDTPTGTRAVGRAAGGRPACAPVQPRRDRPEIEALLRQLEVERIRDVQRRVVRGETPPIF